jgi:hypothetical protein
MFTNILDKHAASIFRAEQQAECGKSVMDMRRAKTGAETRDQSEPIGEKITVKESKATIRFVFKRRGIRQNNCSE